MFLNGLFLNIMLYRSWGNCEEERSKDKVEGCGVIKCSMNNLMNDFFWSFDIVNLRDWGKGLGFEGFGMIVDFFFDEFFF